MDPNKGANRAAEHPLDRPEHIEALLDAAGDLDRKGATIRRAASSTDERCWQRSCSLACASES
jgi:hypothetical protein